MVGRPRRFDEANALENATELFWRHGYESTSVSDLLGHMHISRQSLYKIFGCKEDLFRRVLKHYLETRMAPMLAYLEAPAANLDSIETYFATLAREITAPGSNRKGCLAVNTIVEQANKGGVVAREMGRFTRRLENAMLHALQGAEETGQLKRDLNLREAASFLVTTAQGMMVLCKLGRSRQQQQATALLAVNAIR
jgi:TetR/AcrR family transcriptional repressor of nem operon